MRHRHDCDWLFVGSVEADNLVGNYSNLPTLNVVINHNLQLTN
jgi:hypothetical protein